MLKELGIQDTDGLDHQAQTPCTACFARILKKVGKRAKEIAVIDAVVEAFPVALKLLARGL